NDPSRVRLLGDAFPILPLGDGVLKDSEGDDGARKRLVRGVEDRGLDRAGGQLVVLVCAVLRQLHPIVLRVRGVLVLVRGRPSTQTRRWSGRGPMARRREGKTRCERDKDPSSHGAPTEESRFFPHFLQKDASASFDVWQPGQATRVALGPGDVSLPT